MGFTRFEAERHTVRHILKFQLPDLPSNEPAKLPWGPVLHVGFQNRGSVEVWIECEVGADNARDFYVFWTGQVAPVDNLNLAHVGTAQSTDRLIVCHVYAARTSRQPRQPRTARPS